MGVARRGLLKMIGAAPLTGLASKIKLDEAIAEEAGGIKTTGLVYNNIPDVDSSSLLKLAKLVKTSGLPDVLERRLREQTYFVGGLDADIAAKRSWSMAVKIQHQRERNYNARLQSVLEAPWRETRLAILTKILGGIPWF